MIQPHYYMTNDSIVATLQKTVKKYALVTVVSLGVSVFLAGVAVAGYFNRVDSKIDNVRQEGRAENGAMRRSFDSLALSQRFLRDNMEAGYKRLESGQAYQQTQSAHILDILAGLKQDRIYGLK